MSTSFAVMADQNIAKRIVPILSLLLFDEEETELPTPSPLNDTGITFGGNYPSGNNSGCTGETIAQQDCSHGRDATNNDNSDGKAGLSFTKIAANGNPLLAGATGWACIQDNVTGLMWEKKTTDGGLHDSLDRYNWYNTDPTTNGGSVGFADDDGNICEGYQAGVPSTYCNTQAFVARVNAAGLCGHNDWRLPDQQELRSIVNYAVSLPAVDLNYFVNTPQVQSRYWSSTPSANFSNVAWYMDFVEGHDSSAGRNFKANVRLVR